MICHFCGEDYHIATIGPGYSKVIQYFACKKFVKMTPSQRCAELFRKGLYIQCLLPGASSKEGKHKEGRCQRDFTCKNSAHSKFPSKKHVLICEEHKDEKENKDT